MDLEAILERLRAVNEDLAGAIVKRQDDEARERNELLKRVESLVNEYRQTTDTLNNRLETSEQRLNEQKENMATMHSSLKQLQRENEALQANIRSTQGTSKHTQVEQAVTSSAPAPKHPPKSSDAAHFQPPPEIEELFPASEAATSGSIFDSPGPDSVPASLASSASTVRPRASAPASKPKTPTKKIISQDLELDDVMTPTSSERNASRSTLLAQFQARTARRQTPPVAENEMKRAATGLDKGRKGRLRVRPAKSRKAKDNGDDEYVD